MGFTRRYPSFPPLNVVTEIEGVVVVDQPPPSTPTGLATGIVGIIGEFADVTFATYFNPTTGTFTTAPQPVDVFSAQSLVSDLGGFDPTLGDFGNSLGNGFAALRNKQFSGLVAIPVNISSQYGMRLTRHLPTNQSATVALPITPVLGASVPAATTFVSGADTVNTAAAATFAAGQQSQSGTDGTVTTSGPAVSLNFSSATADFTKAKVGDLLVIGVLGAGGAQGSDAGTYRIITITDAHDVVVETMIGSSFSFAASSALAWRLHAAAQGDTGVGSIVSSNDASYTIPARPMVATIAASTTLAPQVVPTVDTATSWNPLSGLSGAATTNAAGIVYTAAVQAPNAAQSSSLDALYVTAIDAALTDADPARTINILWAARKSSTIAATLRSVADAKSANGPACVAVYSPALSVISENTVLGATYPGVGANRDARFIYNWPGFVTFVPEAVGFNLSGADGSVVSDGILDDSSDGWAAVSMSNLPPENNPAQTAAPIPTLFAPILGFQRGNLPNFQIGDYIAFRSNGIMASKNELNVGFVFQSGITTSLISGQQDINVRRFADFVEDSLANVAQPFAKLPITPDIQDQFLGEVTSFLDTLLSPGNPSAQRIVAYSVNSTAGNTPQLAAAGIYVLIVKVQMIGLANFIVLQVQCGPGVNVSQ